MLHARLADEAAEWRPAARQESANAPWVRSPGGGEWPARFASIGDDGTLLLSSLEPYAAYQFHVSSTNALGTTEGRASAPLFTDDPESKLRRPPTVEAVGSASYTISWGGQAGTHCRPEVRWRVDVRRRSGMWQPIGDAVHTPSVTVHTLRCPEGCAFRVTPTNIKGPPTAVSAPFSAASAGGSTRSGSAASALHSNASAFVPTPPLPPLPRATVRIELLLARPAEGDATAIARQARQDLGFAVGLPPERVAIVEVRGSSHLVADLSTIEMPADGGSADAGAVEGGAEAAAADTLAYRLVDALLTDGSALYKGRVTSLIDPRAGITRLDASGQATQLLTPSQLSRVGTSAAATSAAAKAAAVLREERDATAARLRTVVADAAHLAADAEAAWRRQYGGAAATLWGGLGDGGVELLWYAGGLLLVLCCCWPVARGRLSEGCPPLPLAGRTHYQHVPSARAQPTRYLPPGGEGGRGRRQLELVSADGEVVFRGLLDLDAAEDAVDLLDQVTHPPPATLRSPTLALSMAPSYLDAPSPACR